MGQTISREKAIRAIFQALDSDSSGRIGAKGMRRFATLIGFRGTDDDWTKEYTSICEELQVPADHGVGEDAFAKLLNDSSEKGLYCSDEVLRETFAQVVQEAGPPPLVRDIMDPSARDNQVADKTDSGVDIRR